MSSEKPQTDREKALAGELYNPYVPELVELRGRSRRLQRRYNDSDPDDEDTRQSILQEWLGSKGAGVFIEPPFQCDYGGNVSIGENSLINFDCVILDSTTVEIGSNVKVGPRVQIYTATHPLDPAIRSVPPYLEYGKPIKIGKNVWLGGGCIICPGVTIGENSVIGAGAVVTKNIPANVVAAGNPAKTIKELQPASSK